MAAEDADAGDAVALVAEALRDAEALLICTGAGMGVDSGLGTFRGANAGVWPPLRALQMDFSEMSCPAWFRDDPRLAWAFWHFRHQAYTKGQPHAGYELLAKWGRKMKHGFFSVTSNIDGHWIRTIGEDLTFECHGAVTHTQYVEDDGRGDPWRTDDAQIEALDIPEWDLVPGAAVEVLTEPRGSSSAGGWVPAVVTSSGTVAAAEGAAPLKASAVRKTPDGEDLCRVRERCGLPCDASGAPLRPNVLMFGDWGVNHRRIDKQESRFEEWRASLPEDCKLVVVEVGAGTAVRTIRSIGERAARAFNKSTFVRINLEDSAIGGHCHRGISVGGLGALAALTQIDALLDPSGEAA